jgi:hypothetical protein
MRHRRDTEDKGVTYKVFRTQVGHRARSENCQIRPRRCNYLLTGPGETILDILGQKTP